METINERVKRRKRKSRRRRWAKRLAVCAVLAVMAVVSSWTWWDRPAPQRWKTPDASALAWMMNQAALSPGHARAFASQYPELADLFLNASLEAAP